MITKSYRKVILSGTTLYTSIPREVREILDIKKGDRIMVTYHKDVVKKRNIKKEIYEKKNTTSMFVDDNEDISTKSETKNNGLFEESDDNSDLPLFDFSKDNKSDK